MRQEVGNDPRYQQPPFWKWWVGGRLNACVNCVDRHLDSRGDKNALIWVPEPEDAEIQEILTRTFIAESMSAPRCSGISPA